MSNTNGQKASLLAANLIEEQLHTLSISIAAVAKSFETGEIEPGYLERVVHHRKLRLVKTASGGNIVTDMVANPDKRPTDAELYCPPLTTAPNGKSECLRVIVGNSLIAVGAFMKAHDMLNMRTPEFQFLGHVVEAILNANTFKVVPGYMPVASFDGLVIDSKLNGMPLFPEGATPGFMEFGDALALLQWLSLYLRGERSFVSGGDAG